MCDKLVVSTIEKLDSATVSSQQTITILYWLFNGIVKNTEGSSTTFMLTTNNCHRIQNEWYKIYYHVINCLTSHYDEVAYDNASSICLSNIILLIIK